MPVLVSVCLVIVTIALVAIAVVAYGVLSRMNRVLTELEEGAQILQTTATQITATGREVQEFIVSIRGPARRAMEGLGLVGERAADLGSTVLDGVEGPVRRTMGLFRGVQAGASYFLNRLVHREHAAKNGGNSDE